MVLLDTGSTFAGCPLCQFAATIPPAADSFRGQRSIERGKLAKSERGDSQQVRPLSVSPPQLLKNQNTQICMFRTLLQHACFFQHSRGTMRQICNVGTSDERPCNHLSSCSLSLFKKLNKTKSFICILYSFHFLH